MKKLWQTEQSQKPKEPETEDPVAKLPVKAVRKPEGPEKPEPEQPSSTQATGERPIATPEHRSFVGSAMTISGEIEAAEDLLVAGRIEGSVSLPEHCLTVASDGSVTANISARALVVEGEIEGDVDCLDSVVLKSTARVTGDIRMRRINIMDGAVFNGKVTMRSPEE